VLPLLLLQVVLQAVDALVAANADNVLRAGYTKVSDNFTFFGEYALLCFSVYALL
jgi:hypothetical protein